MEVWMTSISKKYRVTRAYGIVSLIILLLAPCRPTLLATCTFQHAFYFFFTIMQMENVQKTRSFSAKNPGHAWALKVAQFQINWVFGLPHHTHPHTHTL